MEPFLREVLFLLDMTCTGKEGPPIATWKLETGPRLSFKMTSPSLPSHLFAFDVLLHDSRFRAHYKIEGGELTNSSPLLSLNPPPRLDSFEHVDSTHVDFLFLTSSILLRFLMGETDPLSLFSSSLPDIASEEGANICPEKVLFFLLGRTLIHFLSYVNRRLRILSSLFPSPFSRDRLISRSPSFLSPSEESLLSSSSSPFIKVVSSLCEDYLLLDTFDRSAVLIQTRFRIHRSRSLFSIYSRLLCQNSVLKKRLSHQSFLLLRSRVS